MIGDRENLDRCFLLTFSVASVLNLPSLLEDSHVRHNAFGKGKTCIQLIPK